MYVTVDYEKVTTMLSIAKTLSEQVQRLEKEKDHLQYKIDQLMLEFCPEKMTEVQLKRFEECQVKSETTEDV